MFDFTDFARKIYDDRNRPVVHAEEPCILPAFYGGELLPREEGNRFKLWTYTKR